MILPQPGADFNEHFCRVALTNDGVIGALSNNDVVQLGNESIIQDGRE